MTFETLTHSFRNSGGDGDRGQHATTTPSMNFSALIAEEDRGESEERKEPQVRFGFIIVSGAFYRVTHHVVPLCLLL